MEAVQKPTTEGIVPAVGVELQGAKVVVKAKKSSTEPVNELVVLEPVTGRLPDPVVVLTTTHGPAVADALAINRPALFDNNPSSAP